MKSQNQNKNEEKITLESLYALLRKGEEDAQKRAKEFDRKLEKSAEDAKKRSEEFDRDLKKSREEFDRRMKESSEKFDQRMKEGSERFNREIAEINKIVQKNDELIGGIGNSNGDIAEEYFINAFEKNPSLNGETYDTVRHNVRFMPADRQKRSEYNDEFDIFLSNDKSAAIIEVKYNVKKGDISRLLEKGKNYREYFLGEDEDDFKLYLGIAALSFRKTTEKNILDQGIAVIKQVGDKMIINTENLKEF